MAAAPDCQVGTSSQQVLCLCLQGETCHTFLLTHRGVRGMLKNLPSTSKAVFIITSAPDGPLFPLVLRDFVISRTANPQIHLQAISVREQGLSGQLATLQHKFLQVTFEEKTQSQYLPF